VAKIRAGVDRMDGNGWKMKILAHY